MSVKTRTILSIICNAVVLLVTTGVVISYFLVEGKVIKSGVESFMFFTTDSNILAAIGCALVIICDVKILRGERTGVALPFTIIKFAGVVSLLLTFFTVLVLLVPYYGVGLQWGGTGFHMHVAAPLLSFVSFVFLEPHKKLRMRDALFGMLPATVYGLIYFLQVVVFKNWMDFYLFNQGGAWYVAVLLILGITYVLSLLVIWLHNKMLKRKNV